MVCRPDLPVFICVGGRRACPGSQVLFCACRALFFPLIIQVDLAVDMGWAYQGTWWPRGMRPPLSQHHHAKW